ncbi:MAG TPA: EAL domain-containing protein [Candidatus Acidoferrales bacterium]|nr:EAL domain-containing protein [Candidatus Acidoferrales bacterium]
MVHSDAQGLFVRGSWYLTFTTISCAHRAFCAERYEQHLRHFLATLELNLIEVPEASREAAYSSLFESIRDHAIYLVNPSGFISLWNAGASRLFGYEEHEILGQHHSVLYAEEDRAADRAGMQLREARSCGNHVDEHWHRRKDGTRFYAIVSTTALLDLPDPNGAPRGFVRVAHDITQRKETEESMRHEAFHDKLTGLPNRSLFLEHLQRAISHAKRRADTEFAVFFLDIDNFKTINHTMGHAVADRVLVEVAHRLARVLRPEDVIARLGGDEFVILVGDLHDREAAALVAQRVHEAVAEPYAIAERRISTSVSIGVALGLPTYEQPDQVLRDADIAMYAAKTKGRARFMFFDAPMRERALARGRLESDLQQALERDEFRIVYQPIIELRGGSLIGFEALLRWEHPARGLLLPSDFIGTAEEMGLMVRIDRWVLKNACRCLSAWQREAAGAPPILSVNLSSKELGRIDLGNEIAEIVRETGIDASCLRLEITERALMDNVAAARKAFAGLEPLGVALYIDDFGTGYSSLSYLRHLPVSALKVDRSFVATMTTDPESAAIVRSIIAFAHSLKLHAMAEGIETSEQRAALAALHCEFGQGHLFSRELDGNAVTTLRGRFSGGEGSYAPAGFDAETFG